MKKLLSLLLVLMLVMGALAGCGQKSQETTDKAQQSEKTQQPAEETTYQRNETLYAGGGLWAPPSNWNPLTPWNAVTGTVGLIYETLFNYDPLKNEFIPWLAEKGDWTSDNTYQVTLRDGLTWSDGQPLTSEDVKFTFEIAKEHPEIYYSPMWQWLQSVDTPDNKTVVFKFSTTQYHEWQYNLYQIPIIPKHIWQSKSKDDLLTGANEKAIGSGPYLFDTYSNDRMVYKKNDNWWGIKALGMTPQPKRIVYLIVPSNNVALGMLMKGELDISNFFLPGVPTLKANYGITTFYDNPPYMIPDNTVFMFINLTKEPLNNVELRRAMAYAINPKVIAQKVYENQVEPSNPLGFVPAKSWEEYYDNNVVSQYGFSYNPDKAKSILDAAGFKLGSDGVRTTPDGKKFKLEISVPYGWTDWMESAKIVADQLKAVGIDAEAKFPDYSKYWEDLTKGGFDLSFNNFGSQVTSTPWTLYNWLFNSITGDAQYNGNFGRFNIDGLQDMVAALNESKPGTDEAKKAAAKLEEVFLKNIPAIPLWYNGLWFQASNAAWENWPTEHDPYAYPVTWGGRWQTGGTIMLTKIKAKSSQ